MKLKTISNNIILEALSTKQKVGIGAGIIGSNILGYNVGKNSVTSPTGSSKIKSFWKTINELKTELLKEKDNLIKAQNQLKLKHTGYRTERITEYIKSTKEKIETLVQSIKSYKTQVSDTLGE